ncbi:MAG TPA: efflux RND transporter periplasmic adaptor subunit [Bryobacteraceae bacterium]|nr:efflux RND transporter periplasmic adaptor subunit [Bryobacteraceae bacterium]
MNRNRILKISLIGLLVVAIAAFGYFGIVRRQARHSPATAQLGKDVYYCPMHKNYHSDKPGNCPICSMKLVKLENTNAPAATDVAAKSEPSSMPMNMPSGGGPATGGVSNDNAIFVPPEKQQLIGMHSVPAEMGTLTKDIRIVGKVSYDERRLTHIHSKVSGYIEDVFADSVGKSVSAGEPLFTIYSPDLVATEQDYLLALRSRDLLKASTVASAAQGSENLIAAARERLRLWDVTDQEISSLETEGKVKRAIAVYSPVSGVVMERAAYHHGTFVDPSKDLFTIVDFSHVWVLGEVYETDLPFVRTGQAAEIELPYSGGVRKIRGRVNFIYPFLDPKTRTVQARMEFPNSDLSLKPEMFTNITMSASIGRHVLIPQDALMDTGVEQYVFIDKGNGYVEPRKVKVGAEAGDKVGIQEGLRSGEKVVTGANFIVDSESRLKGAFAGMGAPSKAPPSAGGTAQAISTEVLDPKTAKTGMNPIRLLVKDAGGKPITGAQVEVGLFMPQMGTMPPMRSNATLTEVGNGIYAGQIEFQMAWTWQTTVTVRKNGSVVGVAQTNITAR